jgi:hypothetical protein
VEDQLTYVSGIFTEPLDLSSHSNGKSSKFAGFGGTATIDGLMNEKLAPAMFRMCFNSIHSWVVTIHHKLWDMCRKRMEAKSLSLAEELLLTNVVSFAQS